MNAKKKKNSNNSNNNNNNKILTNITKLVRASA